jgi:hypothetical protein
LLFLNACVSEARAEGQFSVTVVDTSGPIDAQVFLVLRDGGYQAGESKDGIFTFTKPVKSAPLLAAALGHEAEKVSYTGQDKVTITMKPSGTRSSVIGDPSATLDGKGGSVSAVSSSGIYAQGVAFSSGRPNYTSFSLKDLRSTSRKHSPLST